MNGNETKLQILDLAISIVLYVVGCAIGKLAMNVIDSWISFNGSAIGILLVGELLWLKVFRKAIIRYYEKRSKGG